MAAASTAGTLPGLFGLMLLLGFAESGNAVYLILGILLVLVGAALCVYFLRGQGPTTQEVESRLAQERRDAAAKRRKANFWGVVASAERIVRPRATSGQPDAAATQLDALSDPETAQALQNLQKLLYTREITDEEFAAAKSKLFGDADDAAAQLTKLSELHAAGILGDVEFAAAKAKALGL